MDEDRQHYRRKIKELQLLFEISRILDGSIDLKDVINPVLRSMAENMGMLRGTITLLNRKTREIGIEASYGLSVQQQERGKYKIGEGITGKVVERGEPMIIPNINNDTQFLNKTGARNELQKKDVSFIIVPIKIGNETIGTLSVDRLFAINISLEEDLRLLSIIGSMIAQAVKLRRSIQEERQRLMEENSRLQQELEERFRPANIIGNSRAMQEVFDLIAQVSKSEATVLIRGESGTGKELVAHAIHYNSLRAERPFIKVNCAALPETVIESELFGHEKGAFTGAIQTRKGRFEQADGGTIFLDEIGDLSPTTQVKLLRVLQEREFERVGGNSTIHCNVRIVAATNRNLEDLMGLGNFREDLYYRLNVFPIHIPPLRDRQSDITLLADYFIEKYSEKNHKHIKRISTSAIELLMSYHWPGNVRELENCIERAVLLAAEDVIHGHHLPPSLQSAESTSTTLSSTLPEALDKLERELLMDALKSTRGNMAKAARHLGISERIMGLRVKKHEVDPLHFRRG
ncbi:nif-specific transcriptional activator NifA [Marispirochaeta aestuarii]|uniref:Nif-specific regulatory protein n=1 Tax=Marispirochaeta aestuarii TaxID=1963862 RepID=A0A1Y1S2S2_9SPIO|nr:nif-specific transcriptional activator NifA [Marispirochaeta aestuarii]ORC38193.1 nif-specific transcriptional activator NifA [Marispirochaeta aestuarii]